MTGDVRSPLAQDATDADCSFADTGQNNAQLPEFLPGIGIVGLRIGPRLAPAVEIQPALALRLGPKRKLKNCVGALLDAAAAGGQPLRKV